MDTVFYYKPKGDDLSVALGIRNLFEHEGCERQSVPLPDCQFFIEVSIGFQVVQEVPKNSPGMKKAPGALWAKR